MRRFDVINLRSQIHPYPRFWQLEFEKFTLSCGFEFAPSSGFGWIWDLRLMTSNLLISNSMPTKYHCHRLRFENFIFCQFCEKVDLGTTFWISEIQKVVPKSTFSENWQK